MEISIEPAQQRYDSALSARPISRNSRNMFSAEYGGGGEGGGCEGEGGSGKGGVSGRK